ncbi:MAG: tyrosine-type recombinase/integrase [Armatimonadota bacterium]
MTDTLPDVMTRHEWNAFIGEFNENAPTGLRNKALFTLMHDAGLRVCEVIGLKTPDIKRVEVDGQEITSLALKETKGGKQRNIYLPENADRLLHDWLEEKSAQGLGRTKWVFCTLKGTQIKSSYLRELAARKGKDAGIDWRVHPHALRHTFATDLLEETGDLALVQDALGHSKPETTRVYAKVKNSRLARAMVNRQDQELKPDVDEETLELAKRLQELPEDQRAALAGLIKPSEK